MTIPGANAALTTAVEVRSYSPIIGVSAADVVTQASLRRALMRAAAACSWTSSRKLLKKATATDFDPFPLEVIERRINVGENERRMLAAVLVDAPANALAQIAWHQNGCVGLAVVPLVHAKASSDLERIAKAISGQQANPGAFALEHAVRRHG